MLLPPLLFNIANDTSANAVQEKGIRIGKKKKTNVIHDELTVHTKIQESKTK